MEKFIENNKIWFILGLLIAFFLVLAEITDVLRSIEFQLIQTAKLENQKILAAMVKRKQKETGNERFEIIAPIKAEVKNEDLNEVTENE